MSQHLNLLTSSEKNEFFEKGFLVLRSVLTYNEVAILLNEVERLTLEATRTESVLREKYYHRESYKLIRILRLSGAFDYLIDHPGYFGKLVSLIGTHIQLMGSEIFIRGWADEIITGFHTDLGAGLQQILPYDENAVLQVKAQIFLTDLSDPNSSNFTVIPGSHRRRVTNSDLLCLINDSDCKLRPDGNLPIGSFQVLAKPGDVVLFPHSLWHAVAPNRSGRTRYSISLRYGQLALRPLERFDPVLNDSSRVFTTRQRRLLCDLGFENPSPYRPTSQDEIIFGTTP